MGAKLEMKRTFILPTVRRWSSTVLNVSDSDELSRRQAREIVGLPREVRLVGVAGFRRGLAQRISIGLHQVEEVPESEHPAERLGPVADRPLEAPAQMTFADVQLFAEVGDACG